MGIGRAIAVKLAEQSDVILINYRGNAQAADETAQLVREKGAEPIVVQANVRDENDCKKC